MKKIILSLILAAACIAEAAGADFKFTDARSLAILGKLSRDTSGPYTRIPESYREGMRDAVWRLGKCSAGIAVRFSSDAGEFKAKWSTAGLSLGDNMTYILKSGMALYVLDKGEWVYVGAFRPGKLLKDGEKREFLISCSKLKGGMHEYILYLGMYDSFSSVEIGVPEGCRLEMPKVSSPHRDNPVIAYGTSILQGASATVSSVASALGWNTSVWDLSTPLPTLKLLPADFNDGTVSSTKKRISIIGDSISTFKGWISSESVGGKVCTTHYPNTSNPACDVLAVGDTWWYKLIYNKMSNAQFEANISSGNTTVVANTTATSYSSQYWYNWDFNTRLIGLGIGDPDIVFIHGGTNDLGHISSYGASECLIGSQAMNSTYAPDATLLQELFNTADAATTKALAESLDATTFCSAYIKLMQMLKVRYPSTKVVCLIGDCLSAGMQAAVKSIADHYGAKYVDFLAINGFKGKTIIGKYDGGTHPNASGMEYMASEIYRELGPWLEK